MTVRRYLPTFTGLDALRVIGGGEMDAFIVSGPDGAQVFTQKGAELS